LPSLLSGISTHDTLWIITAGLVLTALLILFAYSNARSNRRLRKTLALRTQEVVTEQIRLAAVIDHAHDSILMVSEDGNILRVNPAATTLFGYTDKQWPALSIHQLVPEEIRDEHMHWFADEMSGKRHDIIGKTRQLLGQRSDGSQFPCEVTVHAYSADNARQFSVVLHDLTDVKRREWIQSRLLNLRASSQSLHPLHTRFKQMLSAILSDDPWNSSARAGAVFITHGDQHWLSTSFGWSIKEKKRWISIPTTQCLCGKAISGCDSMHCKDLKANGHRSELSQSVHHSICMPIHHDGASLGLICLQFYREPSSEHLQFCRQAQDIIRETLLREQVRQALEESESKHRQLVDTVPMGIIIHAAGKLCYVNPAAISMLGVPNPENVLGVPLLDFVAEDDREITENLMNRLQQGESSRPIETRFLHRDGSQFWAEIRGVPVEYESQPAVQMLIQDISARKQAEQQLTQMSYTDELTGLPNRRLYGDRLEQACSLARRRNRRLCLLFIDLDRFKIINDTRGHACGDKVLQIVAARLIQTLRDSDTAARMGGDEFAVLLPETEPEQALRVSNKLIAALKEPVPLGDQFVSIGASIGMASFPNDGEDSDTLLKHADSAMYHAKENHLDIHCFSNDMETIAIRRMQLMQELASAVERNQLSLHYQSQHALSRHSDATSITGVESLIRWHHPEMGSISPAEFIPLAEETGLIQSITAWVVSEASRQAVRWERDGIRPDRISVNISAAQLMQLNLAQEILTLIRDNGAKPQWIEVEITETAAMNQPETGINIMRDLVAGGISIAIDDFGTGYSSLAYLKRFPADLLKIDIAFIRNLPEDIEDAVIVRSIIAMAHALSLTVIAEGVETAEQLAFLRNEGCDRIQGYLLGKPLPADEYTRIKTSSKNLHNG